MIRGGVYIAGWAVCAIAVLQSRPLEEAFGWRVFPWILILLICGAWALDWGLGRAGYPSRGLTVVARFANLLPILPLALAIPWDWADSQPPPVKHNEPAMMEMIRKLIGGDVPILETWYTQDHVFTGHGAEYWRARFPADALKAMQRALRQRCVASPNESLDRRPVAPLMKWDPPANPVDPHLCSVYSVPAVLDYVVDFGVSGDSVLVLFRGH